MGTETDANLLAMARGVRRDGERRWTSSRTAARQQEELRPAARLCTGRRGSRRGSGRAAPYLLAGWRGSRKVSGWTVPDLLAGRRGSRRGSGPAAPDLLAGGPTVRGARGGPRWTSSRAARPQMRGEAASGSGASAAGIWGAGARALGNFGRARSEQADFDG